MNRDELIESLVQSLGEEYTKRYEAGDVMTLEDMQRVMRAALLTLSERQQEAMKIDTRGSEEQVEAAHCGLYHWNDTLSALREKWDRWITNVKKRT